MRPNNPESGGALPLALVVTLALTLLVGDFALRANVAFDRSKSALRVAQARSLIAAVEEQFPKLSAEQLETLKGEPYESKVDDFTVRLHVQSLDAQINIARLDDLTVGPSVQKLFENLVQKEKLEYRAFPAALDWVDADDDPRQSGAEKNDYIGEDVLPRNGPFETIDELSFVRGFRDPSAFERIRPMLTVHGTGKIYLPDADDTLMDLFENLYGVAVRNTFDDVRKNPGRELKLPAFGLTNDQKQAISNLVTPLPTAWRVTVDVIADRYFGRSEYELTAGDASAIGVRRIQ